MSTHPVEPESAPSGTEPEGTPNPTQLPVEPEFGQAMPPGEPEDPHGKPPPI